MSLVAVKAPEIKFCVLGDSAAYGTGDFDPSGQPRGWGYYLSRSLQAGDQSCDYQNYSRPGAKSDEVLKVQLPLALAEEPNICAVITGGNDMLRNGFDPDLLHANLTATILSLQQQGSTVIMIELHDPCQILRIPRLLKRVLARRVNAVNQVYRKIERELNVLLIKTREIPDVHDLRNWHIDRMHPGIYGHQLLAREMALQLRERGYLLNLPEISDQPTTSRRERISWLICNGAPWFLKRSVDLLPVALFLMACESIRVVLEGLQRNAKQGGN